MSTKCNTLCRVIFMLILVNIFTTSLKANNSMNALIDQNLKKLELDFKVKINDRVRDRVNYYVKKHKNQSSAILGKVLLYKPMFTSILANKDFPEELLYLPIIESELNPHAVSNQGATGMWQFMYATANLKGLTINYWVDERRDPIKSTEAAVGYLSELYNMYGDWSLALAAYNCGPGNVNKAMRKVRKAKTFWDIAAYLPSETQNYVPSFIAAVYLVRYHTDHNIEPTFPTRELLITSTAKVMDKINLKKLAEDLDIPYSTIKALNPSYKRDVVPKSKLGNYITIPHSRINDFITLYVSADDIVLSPDYLLLNNAQTKTFALTTTDGEERSTITLVAISQDNNFPQPMKDNDPSKVLQNVTLINDRVYKYVKLGRGKSLRDVANAYGLEVEVLVTENNYTMNVLPKQGDIIKIPI